MGHVEDQTREQLLEHLRSIAAAGEGSLLEATEGEIRAAAAAAASDLAPLGGDDDEPSPAAAATAEFRFEPIPEDELADPVESAVLGVEAVRRGEMPPPSQLLQVAAIVMRTERPVLTVADSGFDPPDPPWTGLTDRLGVLRSRIRAVGRIRAESAPYGHVAGTGFVVGPGLLLTNRHVAKYFVQGIGTADRLELVLAEEPSCDLDAELGGVTTRILALDAPALMHPYWDVALLRVRGAPLADVEPLMLASERLEPGELVGRAVAVVGYPIEQYLPTQELRDLRARLFGSVYGVKRLMPGRLMDRHRTTASNPAGGEREVAAVGHDASTLAGNSGSAVIDVETGTTLGVHFKGLALDANFAVPTWELARDPRLHDLGVTFAAGAPGPADPEVEAAWNL